MEIDLYVVTAAILNSIVSNCNFGMSRGKTTLHFFDP